MDLSGNPSTIDVQIHWFSEELWAKHGREKYALQYRVTFFEILAIQILLICS